MYRLKLTSQAKKELRDISKFYKLPIADTLEELRDDPFLGKPLSRELLGKFSLRVGVYRIIYKINHKDKTITILSAGHRSIIY